MIRTSKLSTRDAPSIRHSRTRRLAWIDHLPPKQVPVRSNRTGSVPFFFSLNQSLDILQIYVNHAREAWENNFRSGMFNDSMNDAA
jgi:hypothetical protein